MLAPPLNSNSRGLPVPWLATQGPDASAAASSASPLPPPPDDELPQPAASPATRVRAPASRRPSAAFQDRFDDRFDGLFDDPFNARLCRIVNLRCQERRPEARPKSYARQNLHTT